MGNPDPPAQLPGAFLILAFCGFAGILSSLVYSGYLAILLGILAIALAIGTKSLQRQRHRTLVYSMGGASVLLGVGALALGMVARLLA